MPKIPSNRSPARQTGRANPNLIIVAALTGAAIGTILALVILSIIWPEASATANVAITAVSAVAGAFIGVAALMTRQGDA